MSTEQIKPPLPGHRTALTMLVLAYTLSITDRMILSILFPDIQAEFGVSDTQLGLLGGLSFALFYATLGIPIARLSDQYSRKWIIAICLALFSLMTLLSGWATGFIMLLLLRIGVGVGEAGVNPASHSIIADYFPAQRRSFAMAILMLGANLGMMIGFVGGGLIAEHYGWRVSLMVVGAPGLLLSVLFLHLLKEPPRGSFEAPINPEQSAPPIRETAATMWANKAMRHLVAGSTVTGMLSYGLTQWLPTFLIRGYDMSQSQAGIMMAGVFGILGAIGALVGGKLSDRLSLRGFQYSVWMIAGVGVAIIPFWMMAFLAGDFTLMIALLILPAFTANFYLGPTLALVQTLSPVPMRAVASAIKMLCMNLIGLGLGPLIVGMLSDFLNPYYGDSALNVALAIFVLLGLWGALHFWLCGRALAQQAGTHQIKTAPVS
jgi:predicted MFS family arabinose efflux permease